MWYQVLPGPQFRMSYHSVMVVQIGAAWYKIMNVILLTEYSPIGLHQVLPGTRWRSKAHHKLLIKRFISPSPLRIILEPVVGAEPHA